VRGAIPTPAAFAKEARLLAVVPRDEASFLFGAYCSASAKCVLREEVVFSKIGSKLCTVCEFVRGVNSKRRKVCHNNFMKGFPNCSSSLARA
jgi:hypothetical protein